MKEKKFKPLLIGIDNENIEKEMDRLDLFVDRINKIKENWGTVFDDQFSPQILESILASNRNSILRLLQIHFIKLDSELSKLATSKRIKIDKLIDITDFPDFEDLKDAIVGFRVENDRRTFGYIPPLAEVFNDGKWKISDNLKNKITDKNTYYTKNETENLVLEKVQNLCDTMNFFNNCGGNITVSDLPLVLSQSISSVRGERRNKDLKLNSGENPNWFIPKLIPKSTMFNSNNMLLEKVAANYHTPVNTEI